jgi:multiple sugar transport system substrate-binding protein
MKKRILWLMVLIISVVFVTVMVSAAEFDWKKFEGTTLNILFCKHPYAEGIISAIPEFEKLTGITVKSEVLSEDEFFDKSMVMLSAKSKDLDVLMTGVMQTWTFAPPGYLEPLEKYIADPVLTNPDYDFEDIFPRIRGTTQWNMIDGSPVGEGSQWAIPIGFEQMSLIYRADLFEKYNIKVPNTLPEVYEAAKIISENEPDIIAFTHRGLRSWNLMHTGPISIITNYGASDFDKNLQPAMGTPEGIAFHKDFVKLIRDYGPAGWIGHEWYDVCADLTAGKAAMTVDADILGTFAVNAEGTAVGKPGMINWAPVPTKPGGDKHMANLWVWNISMNAASKNKEAAWYFMQWATSKELDLRDATSQMDPVRKSTWGNEKFLAEVKAKFPTYLETFNYSINNCSVLFTPQARMVERNTAWAVALQEMYEGADIEERLEELVKELTLK